MTNKKELEKQAKELQEKLDGLKKLISKCDEEDPFEVSKYKQVCERLGERQYCLSDFSFIEDTRARMKAFRLAQIKQIEKYFNKALNFIIDWSNSSQRKYYPYFEYRNGGWSVYDVDDCFCCSDGAPAYYLDEKTVRYIMNQHEFKDIYDSYLDN